MTPCDFRTHRECTCQPNHCQQQRPAYDLGRISRPVPLYMPSLRDGLALATIFTLLFAGIVMLAEGHQKQRDTIEQESRAIARAGK
ncbi:hypothetical protein [Agrobacterium vitis]|uniref:hypothetical protein n=1 Tax=Agrobacterium vitis TaxID=373 RepID=UPI0012E7A3D4|nr:hypothetical protein [Agrobacterium vitis]MVA33627.1 hypothetical protein [Agrobacterium vitis]